MKLLSPQKEIYEKERMTALQAQRFAQEIAFAPVVFQVSRLMVKFGIFNLLDSQKQGLTMDEIVEETKLSRYAVQVLLESSLTIGTVLLKEDRFVLSKAGWFLLHDEMVQVNMDFNHSVNYLGLFHLEDALLSGKPEGLKMYGSWSTLYEGLSQLPKEVQRSWARFDYFYSDNSFKQALEIIFADNPKTLLDVGGNTGRLACQCVEYSNTVKVTIMDLPQQLEMMKQYTKDLKSADRIDGYPANVLDENMAFPPDFDVIWMSQFLDCFSETEIISILRRVSASMNINSKLCIMETFWDRQRFETASYCLAQISLFFTAMANGNSKMYHSEDMKRYVNEAGLSIEAIHDGLGFGHSIMVCKKIVK
jgi:ubiquinone/menaquinone biosynthesis C-methylase UbiE